MVIRLQHIILILLVFLLVVPGTDVFGQERSRAMIRNVQMDVVDNKVRVYYDIVNSQPELTHRIDFKFITQDSKFVSPYQLIGDVGEGVSPGTGKMIEWDISQDMNNLSAKIKPKLYLDGLSAESEIGGGPSNALLSMLVPGLGDYFVADYRDLTFRPYYRTASSLGLIGLGLMAKHKRYRAKGYYMTWARWDRIWHSPAQGGGWEWEYVTHETWREGELQYWLFKNDAETLITAGALIWAADVIWVTAMGSSNMRLKQSLETANYSLDYLPGGLALTFTRSF